MSTVDFDIKAALESRLATLTGGTPVAYENTEYAPVKGTTYLRPHLLPAETVAISTNKDENAGIYQISIFAPLGKGWAASSNLADAIADHFKPVTELVYNGVTVRCVSVSVANGRKDGAWWHVPVNIRYLSHTTKR